MFKALGRFTYARRRAILWSGVAFLLLGAWAGPGLFARLKAGGYLNPRSESARAALVLEQQFHGGTQPLVVLFRSRTGETVYAGRFREAALEVLERLGRMPGAGASLNYFNTGSLDFVSEDRKSTFAVMYLERKTEVADQIAAFRSAARSPALEVSVGGHAAVEADVLAQVARDLKLAEFVTLPLVAVLLVFIFGSLVAAVLPLAVGGVAILGAFLALRALTHVSDVSVFAVNVLSMLGMGLAIDYSLLVVSRFREELVRHRGDVAAALTRTMETAGHTVLFSGLTVMLSLLSLLLFPQMLLRSMGIGGAVAVAMAVLGSLTLLPAALAALGGRVNALAVRRGVQMTSADERGFWYRLSHWVMKHPFVVLLLTLPLLLLAGSPFLHVRFAMPDERNLPRGIESRAVAETLKREFQGDALTPIEILVKFEGTVFTARHLDALFDYTRSLRGREGVTAVGSLVNLDPRLDAGGKEAYRQLWIPGAAGPEMAAFLDSAATRIAQAKGQFARDSWARIRIVTSGDAQSDEARAFIQVLRTDRAGLPDSAQVLVGGVSAELVDLLADMRATVPWVFATIGVVIFALLFLMLGSIVVPAKAIVLNLLSLTASFGALVWIFQDGHLSGLLGFDPLGRIDALQPILIFVIAFGLSMDYEVFLLGRIREVYDQTHDNTTAVALGLERTGAIITSAAALLVLVIVGFALGKVLSMKQVGVGLALAVFVDATLLRSLLVPATMRLLGHLNWWAPAPLLRLYRRMGLGEPTA
ncbi:MAG: MMPL family transporter [Myxococcaceae bacterium]